MVSDPFASSIEHLFDLDFSLKIVLFGYLTTDSDWCIPARRLDEHLIYLVVDSAIHSDVAGQAGAVASPCLLWLLPDVEHRFMNASAERPITLYHLRFRLPGHAATGRWRLVPEAGVLRHAFADLYDEHHATDRQPLRVRALLAAILLEAQRLYRPTPRRGGLSVVQQRELLRTLRRHGYRAPPALLARSVRLSPDYFRRVFRTTFGMSPQNWIVTQRIDHAASLLLETNLAVGEVAERLGYADVFLFSRQFKKVRGVSPTDHRRAAERVRGH